MEIAGTAPFHVNTLELQSLEEKLTLEDNPTLEENPLSEDKSFSVDKSISDEKSMVDDDPFRGGLLICGRDLFWKTTQFGGGPILRTIHLEDDSFRG